MVGRILYKQSLCESINVIGRCQLEQWRNFLSIGTYQRVCQSIEDQRIFSSTLLLFEKVIFNYDAIQIKNNWSLCELSNGNILSFKTLIEV